MSEQEDEPYESDTQAAIQERLAFLRDLAIQAHQKYRQYKYREALLLYRQVVHDPELTFFLRTPERFATFPEEAESFRAWAVNIEQWLAYYYAQIAGLHFVLGETEDARVACRRSLERDPNCWRAIGILSFCRFREWRWKEGWRLLGEVGVLQRKEEHGKTRSTE